MDSSGKFLTLILANGQGWQILNRKTDLWLDKISLIMQLRHLPLSHKYPKCITLPLVKNKHTFKEAVDFAQKVLRGNFPLTGWDTYKLYEIWFHPETGNLIFAFPPSQNPKEEVMNMVKFLRVIGYEVLGRGGLFIHSGLVEKRRKAVLFAGLSNSGKSTSCRRIRAPWKSWSDDETLLLPRAGKFFAQPFPTWSQCLSGKSLPSWDTKKSFPLKAIFFLKKKKRNRVIPLSRAKSVTYLDLATYVIYHDFSQKWLSRQKQRLLRTRLFSNICNLANKVPAFLLEVSLKGKFWKKIEEVV